MFMPAKTIAVIGAGNRGEIYASWAKKHPDRLRVVAVCDPDPVKRRRLADLHGIKDEFLFDDWRKLTEKRIADAAVVATPDRTHFEIASGMLETGYPLLLEKPMGLTPDQCLSLVELADKKSLPVLVCHVLRYTNLFHKIEELIREGSIGRVQSVYHAEEIAAFHMAHSYVRGRWGRVKDSSPIVLAKCSHDLDLLRVFAGARARKIFSTGGLRHFTSQAMPEGAADQCTDGCIHEKNCPHFAPDLYLTARPIKTMLASSPRFFVRQLARGFLNFPRAARLVGLGRIVDWRGWPVSTITENLTEEGILQALREGPYGRCVYKCENDQPDHQNTIIEYENGSSGVLAFHGFAALESRRTRVTGDEGTIRALFGSDTHLEIISPENKLIRRFRLPGGLFGHDEGDMAIVKHFVEVLGGSSPLTSARESLESHLTAFAAYESMRTGKPVSLPS